MSKANILVVDDQDSIRHFVSRALEDEGYAVQVAGSVRETRQMLEHGHAGRRHLRSQAARRHRASSCCARSSACSRRCGVIMMTAFGELETAVEAMSAGAFWFVKKPFQNEELLALVARALESQKMWIELRRLRHQAFADEDFLHSAQPAACRRPTRSPSRWRAATPPAC